ncbi:MAG: potassium transporter Kup [Rhodospirillales bacterium]|nr:potassium transporter Kup [Rhodospirillales bacterium]
MPSEPDPIGRSVSALMLGAIGIVFGDIGTSPLYTMKETFAGPHPLPLDRAHVLGVLSLVFWSITCIVSLKYVIVVMRADNRGEGGSLALLAIAARAAEGKAKLMTLVGALGIFAAALFYGDSMITPAISVLSAVEGLKVVRPELEDFIIPITVLILFGLFLIQRKGTAAVGALFGPVMVIWFLVLAVLGIRSIALMPGVLWALSPHHAALFLVNNGLNGFLAMGSVVLAVTGAEALYSDMGHFGRLPIRLAWYLLVLPALLLNYFGQGALLLARPETVENPFFRLAPDWAGLPLVVLATIATVIASQAVISGAFSVTRQAVQLGYLPRVSIRHTSETEMGQIYIPILNGALLVMVTVLVLGFQSSSNLAAAYGVAVTGTMLIDTLLIAIVMAMVWRWPPMRWRVLVGLFLLVDLAFFLANAVKIPHGGWFPLAVALAVFVLLVTWKDGRDRILAKRVEKAGSLADYLATLPTDITTVPGTAIFLTGPQTDIPVSLQRNIRHNRVRHERMVLLTVLVEDIPYVREARRVESLDLGHTIFRINLRFGYMQDTNIPKTLANARADQLGFFYEPMSITYFLSRVTILPTPGYEMAEWRQNLFAWMVRSSTNAMEFFHLPPDRVFELGTQVEI